MTSRWTSRTETDDAIQPGRHARLALARAHPRLRALFGSAALAIVVAPWMAACAGSTDESTTRTPTSEHATSISDMSLAGVRFDVRRDPGCGCCVSWVEYMQKHGAIIELTEDAARAAYRAGIGVPDAAASCHTAAVDGYAIEGHVPVGAIERLLAERPDAIGLALPGMPSASPGMGGDVADWESQPVMLIGNNGELTEFDY